jgi:hypothetical protein
MRLRDGICLFATWIAGVMAIATVPGTARAQASDPELRPTRGPVITYAARAGDADATAVELNPGGLALLPATSFDLVGAAAANGTIMPRRGWGLYWGAPLGFGNALGVQLSSVTRDGATGVGGQTVFRLAYALQLGRNAGLGISWAHVWDGIADGADTFDAGLSTRFGRWAGLAVTVEDFAQPHPGGLSAALPRLWTAELVVRPLGSDRLEVAVGAAHGGGDLWKKFVPRARLSVGLLTGLRLYGEAQTAPTIGPAAATNTAGTLAFDANDTRVSAGLAVDFGHARLYNAAHIYDPDSGSTDAGWAGRIDVSGQQRPSVVASTYVARVAFDGLRDDRSFLQLVRRVRALGADPHVAAVLLKIEDVPLGVARIEEVRDLVAFLRAHGKRTFAYAPSPNTRA